MLRSSRGEKGGYLVTVKDVGSASRDAARTFIAFQL
jgi:hypothetical protein